MGSSLSVIQLYFVEMATKLRSTVLVACPVDAILLNISSRNEKRLIGDGYNLVGFQMEYSTREQLEGDGISADEEMLPYGLKSLLNMPLEIGVWATAGKVWR